MHGIHSPDAVALARLAPPIKPFRQPLLLLKQRPIRTERSSMAAPDVEQVLWVAWLESVGK
jgi:hypothetical protein